MAGLEELGEKLLNKFEGSCRLKDGIGLQELIKNMGTEFTLDINPEENELNGGEPFEPIEKLHEFEDFEPYINYDCLASDNDYSKDLPFDELKAKMTSIADDGKVSKQVLRQGSGDVVPPLAVVYYHYNSYLELEEIPFDSSYLRHQKPERTQVGIGAMFRGFEKSILSMKAGEKSRFLIDPSYAFGPLGAPPRIPPDATVLLEIELFKIVDCGEAVEEPTDITEKLVVSFEECYKRAKAFHLLGNDHFQSKNISAALAAYKKAEKELQRCSMNNEDEEDKYIKLLLKVYVNMCICYNNNKINQPEKVCLIAKEAFQICYKKAPKSPKLLFNLAKAQAALHNFEPANKNLKAALRLEPQNKEINNLLKEIEEKRKLILQEEKYIYQKALGFSPAQVESPEVSLQCVSDNELESVLREELQEFVTKPTDHLELPPGFTKEEIQIAKKVCAELGLKFNDRTVCGNRTLSISKIN